MELCIKDINTALLADSSAFIAACEEKYWKNVHKVADYIAAHHLERPIILLSGPSGSGKTTTAHLLESLLDAQGLETHTLSMDNYFHPLSKEESKTVDLEAPERVDSDLLSAQLADLAAGRSVEVPLFDFATNTRKKETMPLSRGKNELIIIEGIHALNPAVINLPPEQTVRLYISVRTRLVDSEGNRLHPKYIRLLRRMLRDEEHRGRPLIGTFEMAESVNRGEDCFIMPYKHHALFEIDTLIPYELALYKKPLSEKLAAYAHIPEIGMLLDFLAESADLDRAAVPPNSLLTEFI